MKRPRATALSVLGATIVERQSLALTLIGLIFGGVAYLVSPATTSPLWLLISICTVFAVFCYILYSAIGRAIKDTGLKLPSLLAVISRDGKLPILLLEPSELFGTSSSASVYYKDKTTEYEVLIGVGSVLAVQGDGKIQIEIEKWLEGNDNFVTALGNQTATALLGTIVRPSAPREYEVRQPQIRLIDSEALFTALAASGYAQQQNEVDRERG